MTSLRPRARRPRVAPWYLVAILAVLLPLAQACGLSTLIEGERPLTTLKVSVSPILTYAPYYVADAEGYFAEQGLKVEFVRLSRGADTYPALVKGELDVAGGSVTSGLFNLVAREPNFKFVADKGHAPSSDCANSGLIASRALVEKGGLSEPSQLKGLRVDIDPVGYSGYAVDRLLAPDGLSTADLQIVNLPEAAAIEALQQGSLDVMSTGEPWITRALQSGKIVVWKHAAELTPNFQLAIVAYGPNLLQRDPEVGQRFMNAYLKGVRRCNEGKTPRNLDILAKATELDRGLLEAMCWPGFRADGMIDTQTLVDFQSWAHDKELLDSPVPVEKFWDPRFVEEANRVLGAD